MILYNQKQRLIHWTKTAIGILIFVCGVLPTVSYFIRGACR